jgi:hypothetical protein
MRAAQLDILELIRNAEYSSPSRPGGYWPPEGEEADELRWKETIDSICADSQALQAIVEDPGTDLYAALPYGEEYNILREVLIVADHNSYHLGGFALLREVLGAWAGG